MLPELPTPRPTTDTPIPAGWSARLYDALAAMRTELARVSDVQRGGQGRGNRTVALIDVDATAGTGDVYRTAEGVASETGVTVRAMGGGALVDGWAIGAWLYHSDGHYWTLFDLSDALQNALEDAGLGIGGHWREKATGAQTIVLDTRDWRRRSIDVSIAEDDPAADDATKTVARKWVRCAWSDVDLVTLGNYTVRVLAAEDASNPGALVLVASGSSTNHYVVWVRASVQEDGICYCGETGYQPGTAAIVDYYDGFFASCGDCPFDSEDPNPDIWDGKFPYGSSCLWVKQYDAITNQSAQKVKISCQFEQLSSATEYWFSMQIKCQLGTLSYIWTGESERRSDPFDYDGLIITRTGGCDDSVSAIVVQRE